MHCLAPGRKWASGAGDERLDGNELSSCLFIPRMTLAFLLPPLFSDLSLFFGGLSLLWTSLMHLGYFSTVSLAGTYQGIYEFSYLHEAYRLTAR